MTRVDEHERARYWETEFLKLLQRILRYARKLTRGDESAAADLVHDVFVRLLRLCPDPAVVGTPEGYVIRMTRNLWTDTTRRNPGKHEISFEDPSLKANQIPAVSPGIQQILEQKQLFQTFEDACHSPKDRQMYSLFLDGYSIKEIAVILGESPESAKVRWRRLKQRAAYRQKQKERVTTAGGTN